MTFQGGSYEINNLQDALNNSSVELDIKNKKIKEQTENLIQLNAEQNLLEKESEQREILNSMLEGVITISERGNILTFNKAAEKIFGYSINEILGMNVSVLMPESDSAEHQNYIQRYTNGVQRKIINSGREVEGKRKNGEVFPLRISINELPKNIDGLRRFIGSCQDVTQLNQQEEQLRRSQKMEALGKLTGGIAHDYNNLLAIIHGYSELLKGKLSDKLDLINYVNEISHAAERGTKLTKKILGFSQHKKPDTKVLNINTVLKDQKFMLEKTLSARINLILNLSQELWLVELDSSDFEDAIINMAINAMHAMEDGGQLSIETKNEKLSKDNSRLLDLPKGDYILLSITDTGEGIDEETKEKIFDPFFTTKGEFGSGLGLSQVYGFVERCGGGIIIDSAPGKGARFDLYFPRSHQTHSETNKNIIDSSPNFKAKEIILVVDDEPALLELSKDILGSQGYQVITASDGHKALDILEKEKVDLVVTDVIMPNMDGYELIKQVQQIYPDIKIQVVTGYTNTRKHEKISHALYENRLSKPYSINKLLLRVRTLLDKNK